MKRISFIFAATVFAVCIFVAAGGVAHLAEAASPISRIVPDCGVDCNWRHLIALARNILNFFIYMAVPIAAIMFAYAGWLFLSARGNPGQITKAREIFLSVAVGLLIVLAAWAVVDFIVSSLAKEGTFEPVLESVKK